MPALDPEARDAPRAGHPVDLVIEGGWRLPVKPLAQDPSHGDVRLEPFMGEAAMPGGAGEVHATLEWRSARGLVRRQGVLRLGRDGGFILSDAREAVVMQRRNFARVRSTVRVAVAGEERDGELITRTVDLSVGGMLVEQAALLEVDERVAFVLTLADDEVVHGEGVVVRATPFGHRAVRFDPFPRLDEQRVARFVFAQEREGRSAAAYG